MAQRPFGQRKRLLILDPSGDSKGFFARLLQRNGVTGKSVATGKQCLEAAGRESYDLILARIPMADLSVAALATGLAQRFSLNAATPLVLLAGGAQYEAARGYGTARIQVVDVDAPVAKLERVISEALGVAVRAAARLDIELEVETGEKAERKRCRTRDISRTGMLLESVEELPIGTEFAFNFTLPERFTPIHGRACVVRHATERERVASGMGVRFVSFPEGAEDAIQNFVDHNRRRAS